MPEPTGSTFDPATARRVARARVTLFASPQRDSGAELEAELAQAARSPIVEALLRSLGSAILVLNRHRQIVAANTRSLAMLGLSDPAPLFGLRPGEAVGCIHAREEAGGCGTSGACASCGAVLAMLVAQRCGRAEERECAVTVTGADGPVVLDLAVRAVPLPLEGHDFLMVSLSDIGAEKRRAALERAFYHDICNVLAGLSAAAQTLKSDDPRHAAEAADDVLVLTERLVHEVEVQRALARARPDGYPVAQELVSLERLCDGLVRLFHHNPVALDRSLAVEPPPSRMLLTDPNLLLRVLTNMLLNAFEATPVGGQVRLAVEEREASLWFRVHNPGYIPRVAAQRIFQRHFTTKKGLGRGEGTFSMKALGERFLGGEVGFESTREGGTTFWLRLPRDGEARRPAPGQSGHASAVLTRPLGVSSSAQ